MGPLPVPPGFKPRKKVDHNWIADHYQLKNLIRQDVTLFGQAGYQGIGVVDDDLVKG